ncbi:MAG: MarR family transcriptional regulator [Gammaproteobacteria bacterium]
MAHCAEVLDRVDKQEGMSQVQLGDAMDLKPANISRILGILESNGLIRREAVGREKKVFLTTKTVSRRASTPTPSLSWLSFPSSGHDQALQVNEPRGLPVHVPPVIHH